MEPNELNEPGQSLEENLPMVTYIMLHRLYDLITIIAASLDEAKTAKMVEYHNAGYLLGKTRSVQSPFAL